MLAALLSSHSNESEISDGGTVGASVTVDYNNPLAHFRSGKGMGEADNTCANNCYVKSCLPVSSHL